MTVAELIEHLSKFHPDSAVVFEAEDDGDLFCYETDDVSAAFVHEGKKITDDDAAELGETEKCVVITSNWS